MSGDPEQEYFADGISEDIITALSKLPQLFSNRHLAFKHSGSSLIRTGRRWWVTYAIVENDLRLTVWR